MRVLLFTLIDPLRDGKNRPGFSVENTIYVLTHASQRYSFSPVSTSQIDSEHFKSSKSRVNLILAKDQNAPRYNNEPGGTLELSEANVKFICSNQLGELPEFCIHTHNTQFMKSNFSVSQFGDKKILTQKISSLTPENIAALGLGTGEWTGITNEQGKVVNSKDPAVKVFALQGVLMEKSVNGTLAADSKHVPRIANLLLITADNFKAELKANLMGENYPETDVVAAIEAYTAAGKDLTHLVMDEYDDSALDLLRGELGLVSIAEVPATADEVAAALALAAEQTPVPDGAVPADAVTNEVADEVTTDEAIDAPEGGLVPITMTEGQIAGKALTYVAGQTAAAEAEIDATIEQLKGIKAKLGKTASVAGETAKVFNFTPETAAALAEGTVTTEPATAVTEDVETV